MYQTIKELLIQFEKELLEPEVRGSKERLDVLIADEFVEYASSGKVYSKKDVLEALPSVENRKETDYKMINPSVRMLSDEIGLVLYQVKKRNLEGEIVLSNRSSVWKKGEDGWKMVFHQGTVSA